MPPKIRVQKKLPPRIATRINVAKIIEEDPMMTILTNITTKDEKPITQEQVTILKNLKFQDGTKVFILENFYIIINFIDLLKKSSFDFAVKYASQSKDVHDFFINLPTLEKERERAQLELDNLQTSIEAEEGSYQCDKCGEWRTISFKKQVKSADEPMTTFIKCLGCSKRWFSHD